MVAKAPGRFELSLSLCSTSHVHGLPRTGCIKIADGGYLGETPASHRSIATLQPLVWRAETAVLSPLRLSSLKSESNHGRYVSLLLLLKMVL